VPVSATATRRVFSGSKCSAFGGSARDCVAWRVRVSLVPGGSFPDRAVRVQVSRSVNAGNLLGFVGRILIEAWTAGRGEIIGSIIRRGEIIGSIIRRGRNAFLSDWH
jgi:hypothetical protein